MTTPTQQKSFLAAVWFEFLFGALLIVGGVLRPAFIWKLSMLESLHHTLGTLGLSILMIVFGVALIVWAVVKRVVLKK